MNIIELPPALKNGIGIPDRGINLVTPATFTNIGNITEAARPNASDLVKGVFASRYI